MEGSHVTSKSAVRWDPVFRAAGLSAEDGGACGAEWADVARGHIKMPEAQATAKNRDRTMTDRRNNLTLKIG
jgi:hypothetical protein